MAEETTAKSGGRLITVSNRLPVVFKPDPSGGWLMTCGSGGLVTALVPVLRDRGGLWIGWPGVTEESADGLEAAVERAGLESGYRLHSVMLTAEEESGFYLGFSNEVAWPIFHDLHTLCNFDPEYWRTYQKVNRKFAEVAAHHARPDDYIWVHDYHLMLMAAELHRKGVKSRIGFFLHIPFPPQDIFLLLPWRLEILEGLLRYDFIGFQTQRDSRNFLRCVEGVVPDAEIEEKGRIASVRLGDRTVRVGYFPISIDFEDFASAASSSEVADLAWYIHEQLPDRKLVLGIDRLDYTKGIPYRLAAFREALVRYPELQERLSLVQVVVPSREDIPEYAQLREEIEGLVGRINGELTRSGWVPVHYIYRSLDRNELLAYYRTAEMALVTPIKDGMNLVSKEYCACNVEENGVLILSEFAGSADQLQGGAILVNPFDIEGMAQAIYAGFKMEPQERKKRMSHLRETIRSQDIFWWVDSFLTASIEKGLQTFPLLKEYTPRMEID